jgi:hypothetical protein
MLEVHEGPLRQTSSVSENPLYANAMACMCYNCPPPTHYLDRHTLHLTSHSTLMSSNWIADKPSIRCSFKRKDSHSLIALYYQISLSLSLHARARARTHTHTHTYISTPPNTHFIPHALFPFLLSCLHSTHFWLNLVLEVYWILSGELYLWS